MTRAAFHRIKYKAISKPKNKDIPPDPYQKKVFFEGALKESGWAPCGNGYRRVTGQHS